MNTFFVKSVKLEDAGTVNFVGDGAARKPVLFNPIPDGEGATATTVPDAEIGSDDEDTRPYKCNHCNKGSGLTVSRFRKSIIVNFQFSIY